MTRTVKCLFALLLPLTLLGACSESDSYSHLLKVEEKATNWYMAQKKIALQIPADSVFEIGENAPFYKMDEDGYLYMQVINRGDTARPKQGDKVYFRFRRLNVKMLYKNGDASWDGNADNMEYASAYFWFDNYQLENSQKYGSGIQKPLEFLGYDSEVNLMLRSYVGFAADQSQCIPYIVNVKYFKPEY